MSIESIVSRFAQERATAILRTQDQLKAASAMEAVVRGGFRILEFTLTVPGAFELISEFSGRDGLLVGAGTVLDETQATQAVASGAQFLVSPVVDEAVIRAASEAGVASMPGTHTATEMYQAHRWGATFCKLFPAPANGPDYLKALLGPMPFLKIIPTNGTDHQNAGDWIRAGAFGVGFVAPLFEPEFLEREDWAALEQRARDCLAAVAQART
ncbi:MAG: bifunctional 4-hydroxy-2-oxoglutarate aldolase/2-dehydro-3-deoxy-phosphogluconate aldolase [Xanthomonadales bacterium]|nr:bifunctional 4-hydroxy-2-oxoglutarate aldolase/2-dehydro-3-deoxy-phosphogluconate aldolase [Xanthomonadales bacterium]